jgi:drug/metabolite transporter (DMT)-like permease
LESTALAALVAGACAIALAPIFVRFADVGSSATGFYRMFFAGVVLTPWLLVEQRRADAPARMTSWQWLLMFVAGACFGADVLFFHAASRMTAVANATLFLNFAPIFVVLGARFLFGEPVHIALAAGLGIAIVGAALLMSHSLTLSLHHLQGDAFGLIAAVFYAGYLLAVSRLRVTRGTAEIMVWTSFFGAAVIVPVMLLSDEPALAGSAHGWLVLLALGALSHASGQSLIAYALAHLPVGFSGVALLVQPVAAAVFAWALLAEALGPTQLVGGAVVICGVLLARRAVTPRRAYVGAPKSR